MFDVVGLGEVLIDFTPAGISGNGNVLFERNPGGAPANVLAAVAKLGGSTAFIGKVGNDQFGNFLKEILDKANVDTRGLVFANDINTTLAFVHLNEHGDRSFSFYRKPGADMMLTEQEVNLEMVQKAKVFHFGSVSMTHEPARTATLKAAKFAKEKGVHVSYDPNLRPPLWESLEQAKKVILEGMAYADILKISEEELEFLTGIKDMEEGSKALADHYGLKLVFITLGPKGCFYRRGNITGQLPTYDVATIDTTGAGDAFLGGALYKLLQLGRTVEGLSTEDIKEVVDFANAVGSLTTTRKGAIPALPSMAEVMELEINGTKNK